MQSFEETKQLLHDSSFFYIITTNMQGRYSYVNNHYKRRFEGIHGEIVGQPYQLTMHPDDSDICVEVSEQCFKNRDRVFPATIRKHDGNGGFFITQWEYKAIFAANGEPEGVFCLGYDITDYMQDRNKLSTVIGTLQKKESVLKEIAFDQAHLIRAPLANIMGLVNILENMEMDQNLKSICNMLMESSQALDKIVREIVNKTGS